MLAGTINGVRVCDLAIHFGSFCLTLKGGGIDMDGHARMEQHPGCHYGRARAGSEMRHHFTPTESLEQALGEARRSHLKWKRPGGV